MTISEGDRVSWTSFDGTTKTGTIVGIDRCLGYYIENDDQPDTLSLVSTVRLVSTGVSK